MKKILIALSSLAIFTSTTTTVVSCKTQVNNLTGNDDQSEPEISDLDYKVDLATDLKTTNLGIIDKTNEDDIIDLIGYLNPQIVSEDLKVNRMGSNYAQILPREDSYVYESSKTGVIVNFQIQPKISLAKAILTTNLGDIEGTSVDNIKEALKTANPNLNVSEIEVVEPSIASKSAIIKANFNGIYKGQLPISYSMVARALKEDVLNPNLGMILNNDLQTIKNKTLELNPNLKLYGVVFEEITDNSFVIKGKGRVKEDKANEDESYYSQKSFIKGTFLTPKNSILDDLKGFDLDLGEVVNNSHEILKQELLKQAPNLKVDEILISEVNGTSFKISANPKGNFYYKKLKEPVSISFTLPTRATIGVIKPFKIVNYRTRIEVESLIKNKIIEQTAKSDVKINLDYVLEYGSSVMENQVLPVQRVHVKASKTSAYLDGNFSFEIIDKLNLAQDRSIYNSPIVEGEDSNKNVFSIIKEEVDSNVLKQVIDEEIDSFMGLLKVVEPDRDKASLYHYYKHANKNYYQKLVIKVTGNHLFKAKQIIWNNIVAPKYGSNEINGIDVNDAYSLSFVDSSNDKNYPHVNDNNVYRNGNPRPGRKDWEYSQTITFGSFNFYEKLKINSLKEFFRYYQVSLFYEWGANIWTSAISGNNKGWKYWAGKEIEAQNDHWNKTKHDWKDENQLRREMSGNNEHVTNLKDSLGDLYSQRKALAGYNLWIEVKDDKAIFIKGQTISAYNWANASSINHAAFILLKATEIKINPK